MHSNVSRTGTRRSINSTTVRSLGGVRGLTRTAEWTAPVAITARYAHPLEDVLSNIGPVFAGPLVMGSHFASVWLWLVIGAPAPHVR